MLHLLPLSLQYFLGIAALVIVTWMVAWLTRYTINTFRERYQYTPNEDKNMKWIANSLYWGIWVIMIPFIFKLLGFQPEWLSLYLNIVIRSFRFWAVGFVLCMVLSSILFIFRETSKVFTKRSLNLKRG
jgi:hypothetical protein